MIILDKVMNTEIAASSNIPYHEVLMEVVQFCTECDNEEVQISISIPFSGHIVLNETAHSNAIRVYLDGDGYYQVVGPQVTAEYWNGELLLNSGTFPSQANLPVVSHLSGTMRKVIKEKGYHSIVVQSSGGALGVVSTIKSQRQYQVYK